MEIAIHDLEFRRLVNHLHSLGPRALGEFLTELGTVCQVAASLRRYEGLTEEAVAITGADDWPSLPLHLVKR